MVNIRVHMLMAERRENVTELSKAAGIAYGTAFDLYHGTIKRLDLATLDRLCKHFGVGVGDILEYKPDEGPAF